MKKPGRAEDGEMRAEYDFSKARPNPYAKRANEQTCVVVLEPELQAAFPNSESVNEALRLVLKAADLTRKAHEGHQKASQVHGD